MAREVLCIARKGGSLLEKLSVFLEMSRVYGVDDKYDGTLSNFPDSSHLSYFPDKEANLCIVY